jgi:hypothetical protein
VVNNETEEKGVIALRIQGNIEVDAAVVAESAFVVRTLQICRTCKSGTSTTQLGASKLRQQRTAWTAERYIGTGARVVPVP